MDIHSHLAYIRIDGRANWFATKFSLSSIIFLIIYTILNMPIGSKTIVKQTAVAILLTLNSSTSFAFSKKIPAAVNRAGVILLLLLSEAGLQHVAEK